MTYGDFLLKLARQTIENYIKNKKIIEIPKEYPKELNEKRGVFVTIYKKYPYGKELRGCVGLPYPDKPLIEGVTESAISACKDMRFTSLKPEELKDIAIEVSVLTKPELIEVKNPKEYLKKIKIGRDGLIIKKGIMGGLLLPKVPVEQNWDIEEYLQNLCYKAGLTADSWCNGSCRIYKFEAEVFEE